MSTTTPFLSSQISIYNPGRLSDEEIERIFITRKGVFKYLFDLLVAEPPGNIPQHHLVIGERGMGKSTLLHRIAAEFRKQPHREAFLPLTFPEEQYNIDRLSKFWLNCLDALADALDRAGEQASLVELDADIDRWQKQARNISAMEMYAHFKDWSKRLNRRVVLLVDNLNLIFNKISKEEQHQLRAILMKNGAPILVGASAHSIEDVVDYGAPFYDAFKIQTLKKLSFDEVLDTLKNLAEITNNTAFINELYAHRGRLRALYQLTGGTPRTLTMLYPLIREGFSISIQTDLEALMDMATSLYKSRFEELPAQMQVVLDAIAMHWDPAHLEALREITHLDNAQLSPQIKRLYDTGWINRLDAYRAKGNAYEISERFFNIWYLMRRSSRRQKRELVCLTKFLATMYGEELPDVARKMLKGDLNHPDHAGLHLAMADAVKDKNLANRLRNRGYKALLNFAMDDPDVLKNFDIPKEELTKKEVQIRDEVNTAYKKNDYLIAVEKLKNLLKLNDRSSRDWAWLGYIYTVHLGQQGEAEQAYLKAIELDNNFIFPWKSLGNLYIDHMGRYAEAEQAYLKTIELDKNDAATWYNLGNLYQIQLARYDEAEQAYHKAIELDEYFAWPWHNLGALYQEHLGRFTEAEQAYRRTIELDINMAQPWNNLGNLYLVHMSKYVEAEQAYRKAIELDKNYADPWNGLGKLFQDYLGRYDEAENAYQQALKINPSFVSVKLNLIFLFRENMARLTDAKLIFEQLKPEDGLTDSYYLHSTLFAFYEKNLGIASLEFQKALEQTNGKFSLNTQDDWHRFAAVAHKLGYAHEVLQTLEKTGYDIQLRPYYVAIKALGEKDSKAFLNSIAVEVREPAAVIMEKIKRYL